MAFSTALRLPGVGALLRARSRGGRIHTARAIGRVKSIQATRSIVPALPRVTILTRTLRPGPPTDATIPNTMTWRRRRLSVASPLCRAVAKVASLIQVLVAQGC